MDGKSLDLKQDKIEKLKEIIPEAFTEGLIDWEKLKALLGEEIEFKNERYVLNWIGKTSEQIDLLQLDKGGIKVAEYKELPEHELLEQKLHKAVESARKRLVAKPA
ncbi:MAG: hypothetical protein DRH21_00155 [Deltaproteobacteria bacterium]|nr:MAG: hypothetical protein DRH21_00155 [Deltaproteobacteria bacterium]